MGTLNHEKTYSFNYQFAAYGGNVMFSKKIIFTLLGILATVGIIQTVYPMQENTGLRRRATCTDRTIAMSKSVVSFALGVGVIAGGALMAKDIGAAVCTENSFDSRVIWLERVTKGMCPLVGFYGGHMLAKPYLEGSVDNFILAIKKQQ